jgi:hypothetical protein
MNPSTSGRKELGDGRMKWSKWSKRERERETRRYLREKVTAGAKHYYGIRETEPADVVSW